MPDEKEPGAGIAAGCEEDLVALGLGDGGSGREKVVRPEGVGEEVTWYGLDEDAVMVPEEM